MGEQAVKAAPDSAAPAERGSLVIADKVLERIASIVAGEHDQVTDRATSWRQPLARDLPRASATVSGGRARLSVQVAASWPSPLSKVAATVRERVQERVTTLTGVVVTAVDVTIADVQQPRREGRRVT